MHRYLAWAALAASLASAASAAPPASGKTATPDGRVQTTDDANRQSLQGAAKAPLRDLNVIRTEIPDALLQAMNDPYAKPKGKRCQEIISDIVPLDDALGADIDHPPTAEEQSLIDRGRPMALGAVAGVASDAIPFRGVVRYLSGAAQHDQYVQAAITAGRVRRAYLKGLGEQRGCPPPATPSHELAGRVLPPPAMSEGMKPRYPIR